MSDYIMFLCIIIFYDNSNKLTNYFEIKRDNIGKHFLIVALLIGTKVKL